MAKTSFTMKFQIEGLRETLKAFSDLPKDASTELRDASLKLSRLLATKVAAEGKADGAPQSALVADTVKATRDRVPAITAGGTRKLGRNKAPAYTLLFGSVFGSNTYRQFGRPHRGRDAYWFFDVVERDAEDIARAWNEAADAIVRKFSEGA